MINLINTIGQRRLAKFLFLFAIFLAFFNFFITSHEQLLITWKVLLGIILLSFPNGMTLLLAIKTRKYRLFSIFISFCLLVVNNILYYLNIPMFLFMVTLAELILSFFITMILLLKNKKEEQNKSVQQKSQTVKK
jgi:hypothetical protein